jgi:hypothetical protein
VNGRGERAGEAGEGGRRAACERHGRRLAVSYASPIR